MASAKELTDNLKTMAFKWVNSHKELLEAAAAKDAAEDRFKELLAMTKAWERDLNKTLDAIGPITFPVVVTFPDNTTPVVIRLKEDDEDTVIIEAGTAADHVVI